MSTKGCLSPHRPKPKFPPLRRNPAKRNSGRNTKKIVKPPPIVIPIQGRKFPISNTPVISFNIKNVDKTDSFRLKVLHPLTPHVQSVHNLMPLIQRYLNVDVDHSLISQTKNDIYSERSKSLNQTWSNSFYDDDVDSEVVRINETLNTILKSVTDPVYRHGIPPETYITLIKSSMDNIFRPLVKIEMANEFSEVSVIYEVNNWENCYLHHQILHMLMLDHSSFASFIDMKFSMKLVEALETPVAKEQKEFEETIDTIIKSFTSQRHCVLKYMTEKIIEYLDNPVKSNMIAPLLRLFMSFFSTLRLPLKQTLFMTFRTVFYPLIATAYAYDFESPLRQISAFFQKQDPATTLWCLKYLSKHWPTTNTKKSLLCLHELSSLVNYLPESMLSVAAPIIAKSFARSIASPHVTTCVFAILFCQDDSFFVIFNNAPELVAKYIIPAVNKACKIWKTDAREIAEELKIKVNIFLKKIGSPAKEKKSDYLDTWNSIVSAASENYDEFSNYNLSL